MSSRVVLVVAKAPDPLLSSLEGESLSLRSIDSASGAVAAFDEESPDAVLVHLDLRGALDLIRALRDPRRPHVPILVVGRPDNLGGVTQALSRGADDFVFEPVDVHGLRTRLLARTGVSPRSASFTPVTLQALESIPSARAGTYCPLCVTVVDADASRCATCASTMPSDGWAPCDESGLPYLGAVVAGKFLLDQFIADGSSGHVYRAVDLYLKRHYAAKVIELAGVDTTEREAAEREAVALAQLGSPHVAPIYELHELQGERLLVVSEFIEGCTLSTLVARSGPMPPTQALDVVRQAAQGLHEAHQLGMVHRDVKPSNLVVQQLPAGGRFVRVLDFGLVRLRGALEPPDVFYGTPLYAAPEQLLVGQSVDARSDVYSLGLVLLFLLTGASPRTGDIEEIVADRLAGVVDGLEEFADELPGVSALAPLVAGMTAPEPDDRILDMQAVILAIDRVAGFRMDTGAWSVV